MRLHPCNVAFEWRQPTGPFRRIAVAQAGAFGRDGAFVARAREITFRPHLVAASADLRAFYRSVENGRPWIVPGGHLAGTLLNEWTPLGFRCFVDPPKAVPLELTAGSIAVFSSLTPHRTGPNRTDGVRKAYILQYAPDGATMYPANGEAAACDVPERQYSKLIGGASV